MKKKGRHVFTKDDFVDALRLRDEAAHKLLVFKLACPGRFDRLIVRIHGLLQLEPQVFLIRRVSTSLCLCFSTSRSRLFS